MGLNFQIPTNSRFRLKPTDTGVLDRQNLQFIVQGEPAGGALDLAGNTTLQAIGGNG